MDETTGQQTTAKPFQSDASDGKGFPKRVAAILLILVLVIVAAFVVYSSNASKAAAGSKSSVQTSTISSQNNVSTTVPGSFGPIAPGHGTSTIVPTNTTTSTVPAGIGQCPCPSEDQISAMLNYSPATPANVTFISEYASNSAEMVQLQAQGLNLSQSEQDGIGGGWIDSYTTSRGGGPLEIFSERIVQTTETSNLSASLVSLIKTDNSPLSTGEAGEMNYSYFAGGVAGSKDIIMVGSSGVYVVDLSVVVPADSSLASVNAIAQQVSASLG